MPTFYAQKTAVQLSVADLGRATTPNPRTQQSHAASECIRNVAQEFARDSKDGTLTETPLYTEDGSHVRFLGKHETMPFFIVHAGKNFFDLTTKERRNRRPARVPLAEKVEGGSATTAVDLNGGKIGDGTNKDADIEPNPKYKPPLIPHALCLTVFLSNSSFVRTKDKVTGTTEMNDVKIDVYFNGSLCGSHYVPRRYSGEAYAMTEHTVRFAGRRIGRLIEKPWVIVPSGQNPDGSLREYRRGKTAYTGAQQRWNDISDALTAEADKTGRDGRGERPVIGEYLESLAQLSMPKEIEDMQKAGSTKFGILDVVIIWGMGNKDGPEASYIVEPTPIRNDGFTTFNSDQSADRTPVQSLPKTPCTAPNSRSKGIKNAESIKGDSDTTTMFPQTLTPTRITTPNTKTNPTTPSPPEKRPHPALQPEEPRRRPRGHYWDILTTKQTLCEQFSSIATATDFDPRTDHSPTSFLNHARTARPSNAASTAGSSPLSSAPTTTRDPTPAQTKIVKFKTPSPINPATSSSVTNATRMKDKEADSEFLIPLRERTPAPRSKRRERVPTQPSAETLDREFVTPALSADCGVTYAPAGIFRNVGAARAGVFREGGVVMGARFVVGG